MYKKINSSKNGGTIMKNDLTESEMRDYIYRLERKTFYMDMLIEAYEKMNSDIRNLAEPNYTWLTMDTDEYVTKYNEWISKMNPNETMKMDERCAYAGKTGQATATMSSILITLNSFDHAYSDCKDTIQKMDEYMEKYREDKENS